MVIRLARYLHHKTYIGRITKDAIDQLFKDTNHCLKVQNVGKNIRKSSKQIEFLCCNGSKIHRISEDVIPEEYFCRDHKSLKATVSRPLYCTTCFDQCDLINQSKQSTTWKQLLAIEVEYCRKNRCMVEEDSHPKYSYLASLAFVVLLLLHGMQIQNVDFLWMRIYWRSAVPILLEIHWIQ